MRYLDGIKIFSKPTDSIAGEIHIRNKCLHSPSLWRKVFHVGPLSVCHFGVAVLSSAAPSTGGHTCPSEFFLCFIQQ